jgi:hypothetical protein
MRINPNNNSIKLQQQQILLKYKIRQNEINISGRQPETNLNNNKSNVSYSETSNAQKLAFIKSKIKTEYANLYNTK